jgi:outer membrane lipoprotein carrier protein
MAKSMKSLLVVMLVGCTLSAPLRAGGQSTPTAAELAKRIQAHYATVRDFTADFTATNKGGVLPQSTVERGRVKIKKPGRMRWTYESPEKKEFVADGAQLYSYVPSDKVCYVSKLPEGDAVSTAVLFLAGKGNLEKDFKAALPATTPPGQWRLQLTPTASQPDFERLTLTVEANSLKLIGIETLDTEGGTTSITFANLRENASLGDREFTYSCPRGAHVEIIR